MAEVLRTTLAQRVAPGTGGIRVSELNEPGLSWVEIRRQP